jgi:hypothetical protein
VRRLNNSLLRYANFRIPRTQLPLDHLHSAIVSHEKDARFYRLVLQAFPIDPGASQSGSILDAARPREKNRNAKPKRPLFCFLIIRRCYSI